MRKFATNKPSKRTRLVTSDHYTTEEPDPIITNDRISDIQLKHPTTHGRPPFSYIRDPDCKWFGWQMWYLYNDPEEVLRCASIRSNWQILDVRRLLIEAIECNPQLIDDIPNEVKQLTEFPPHLQCATRSVTLGKDNARKWAKQSHPEWVPRLYSFRQKESLHARSEQEALADENGSFSTAQSDQEQVTDNDEPEVEPTMFAVQRARKRQFLRAFGFSDDDEDEKEEESEEEESRAESQETSDTEYEVEKLLQSKRIKGNLFYLVQWKPINGKTFEPTWEPQANVSRELEVTYWRNRPLVKRILNRKRC